MEYGDKIKLSPTKIVIWFGGEIKLIDQIDSQSVLLRTDEVEKLRKFLNQSNDPQDEGVKAPSERSRSPSNPSSTTEGEK